MEKCQQIAEEARFVAAERGVHLYDSLLWAIPAYAHLMDGRFLEARPFLESFLGILDSTRLFDRGSVLRPSCLGGMARRPSRRSAGNGANLVHTREAFRKPAPRLAYDAYAVPDRNGAGTSGAGAPPSVQHAALAAAREKRDGAIWMGSCACPARAGIGKIGALSAPPPHRLRAWARGGLRQRPVLQARDARPAVRAGPRCRHRGGLCARADPQARSDASRRRTARASTGLGRSRSPPWEDSPCG